VNDDWQQCSQPATRSQRFVDGKPASRDAELIVVGAQESYAPRCRKHYIIVQ
jgi:thymidine kinase